MKENIKETRFKVKLSYLILRILFGLVFIVSACLKLAPIEAFEMVLIKQVGISWSLAPLMARSLILFELVLGTSIAFGFWTRAMVMAAQAMTAGFTVYLTLLIVQGSGDDNCGCFGELAVTAAEESASSCCTRSRSAFTSSAPAILSARHLSHTIFLFVDPGTGSWPLTGWSGGAGRGRSSSEHI